MRELRAKMQVWSTYLIWVVALFLLSPTTLRAQTPTRTLRYSAPETCPNESRAVELFTQILDTTNLNETLRTRGHSLDWTITQESNEFLSRIWLRIDVPNESASPAGLREQRAADCTTLVEAGVLVVALSVDADATSRFLESNPDFGGLNTPREVSDTNTESAPSAPTHPEPAPAAPFPIAFSLYAHLGPDFGLLPTVGFWVGGGVRLYLDALRLELGVRGIIPQTIERSGGGVDIGYVLGTLAASGVIPVVQNQLQFGIGGVVEAGALVGQSRGTAVAESGSGPYASLGVQTFLRYRPIDAFAIEIGGDIAVPFARTRFRLESVGDVFVPSSVVGKAFLGVEVVF